MKPWIIAPPSSITGPVPCVSRPAAIIVSRALPNNCRPCSALPASLPIHTRRSISRSSDALRHGALRMTPEFESALLDGDLRASGHDAQGDLRAIELKGHPFFVATLFQPERAALDGHTPALVSTFLTACASQQQ